jgi:uncharacterized damage-inducible protein DinB
MTAELLPEFDQEMAATRRLLARAPAEAFTWSPHPRSFTLGDLCTHLTRLPGWGQRILSTPAYDLVTDHAAAPPAHAAPEAVLAAFDQAVSAVRATLVGMSDAELRIPWNLTRSGTPLFTAPRIAAFKTFVINHTVHHRGQLSVYLRLLDVPVPPMYGPTADETL